MCYPVKDDPLKGVEDDIDVGKAEGIRVMIKFEVMNYPPFPLDINGEYPGVVTSI